MNRLQAHLQSTGMTIDDFRKRKKAWLFYGKDVDRLNRDIESHNRGVIIICHKCHKVDVHPVDHASECDPEGEYNRQLAQDVYWK